MSEFGFPAPNTFLQASIHEHSYFLLNAMVVCIPFFFYRRILLAVNKRGIGSCIWNLAILSLVTNTPNRLAQYVS